MLYWNCFMHGVSVRHWCLGLPPELDNQKCGECRQSTCIQAEVWNSRAGWSVSSDLSRTRNWIVYRMKGVKHASLWRKDRWQQTLLVRMREWWRCRPKITTNSFVCGKTKRYWLMYAEWYRYTWQTATMDMGSWGNYARHLLKSENLQGITIALSVSRFSDFALRPAYFDGQLSVVVPR